MCTINNTIFVVLVVTTLFLDHSTARRLSRGDDDEFVQQRYNDIPARKSSKRNNRPPSVGHFERSDDKISETDPGDGRTNEKPGIWAFGPSKKVVYNGEIERISLDADNNQFESDNGSPKNKLENKSGVETVPLALQREMERNRNARATRSIERSSKNDLEDLEAEESKVFRPLFVYRQQVADRQRISRRREPIYGAYQYRALRPRPSGLI